MANADSMADEAVTVVVPARCAERFRREVLSELSSAAEGVVEGARWLVDGTDRDRLDHADLPRLHGAVSMWSQARAMAGDTPITGPRSEVASLLRCSLYSASEQFGELAHTRFIPTDLWRIAMELRELCDIFELTGLPTSHERGEA